MTASQYVLPADQASDSVATTLEAHFELEAERPESVDRAFYDTFDGLVRAAGSSLSWHAGKLALVDGDGRESASIDWPRRAAAVQVADLATGALRDQLATTIDLRAAMPVARVRSRRHTWRVLDGERKTIARVVVEEPAIATGSRERTRLATRVSVIPVRGYDKAVRRVRRVLERELGLSEASESLVDEAVVRAGGTPGGVSSKLKLALEPDERADRAAAAILVQLMRTLEDNLPGTLADIDSEFLHDLRVAVRRTRSLQRELKGVFPREQLAHFRAEFRWLQAITGPTRDLDVYLLEFEAFAATLPAALRDDLEPLHALLAEHRRRERRRMVRALRSARTQTLLAAWKELIEQLPELPQDDRPDAAHPVAEHAAKRISVVYGQMLKMGGKVDDQSPPEALHDLRKKAKELRYLLEFFAGLFAPETVAPMVKTLKSLQDTLGRFQDREVQAEVLRSLGSEISAQENGAPALMAMGVLVQRLEEQQAQARAEFAERFAPFAAKSRRRSVTETFG